MLIFLIAYATCNVLRRPYAHHLFFFVLYVIIVYVLLKKSPYIKYYLLNIDAIGMENMHKFFPYKTTH